MVDVRFKLPFTVPTMFRELLSFSLLIAKLSEEITLSVQLFIYKNEICKNYVRCYLIKQNFNIPNVVYFI